MSSASEERRVYEAALRSGWDTYYTENKEEPENPGGAIPAACKGDVTRLVDCLRGRKLFTEEVAFHFANFLKTKLSWRSPKWKGLGARLQRQSDADFDGLANLVAEIGRRRGRQHNEPVHAAARLAEVLLAMRAGPVPAAARTAIIKYACEVVRKESGTPVPDKRVRDLLDRKKERRRKF